MFLPYMSWKPVYKARRKEWEKSATDSSQSLYELIIGISRKNLCALARTGAWNTSLYQIRRGCYISDNGTQYLEMRAQHQESLSSSFSSYLWMSGKENLQGGGTNSMNPLLQKAYIVTTNWNSVLGRPNINFSCERTTQIEINWSHLITCKIETYIETSCPHV